MPPSKEYEGSDWAVHEEKVIMRLYEAFMTPSPHLQVCCNIVEVRKIANIYILAEWTRANGRKQRLVLGKHRRRKELLSAIRCIT